MRLGSGSDRLGPAGAVIRVVRVCCVDWDGRRIVGGLEFEWSDGTRLQAGTMEGEESENVTRIQVQLQLLFLLGK